MRDFETSLPFVQHLRAEHLHLNQAVRELRKTVHAPVTGTTGLADWQRAVAGMAQALREQLVHHFAEEEAGGCLEEAVCRCPSLAGEMELLEKEHQALLAKLDHLLALAEHPNRRPGLAAHIRAEFDALAQALMAHEEREHRLVERGLSYATDDTDPIP